MNRYAVTDMIKAGQADMKLPTNGLKARCSTPCKSGNAPENQRTTRPIRATDGRISHPEIFLTMEPPHPSSVPCAALSEIKPDD